MSEVLPYFLFPNRRLLRTTLLDRISYDVEPIRPTRWLHRVIAARPPSIDHHYMFEQAFRNIDDILRKEAGCTTELDYTEQTSWLLFLKYLDGELSQLKEKGLIIE